jgi:hypothetical protein
MHTQDKALDGDLLDDPFEVAISNITGGEGTSRSFDERSLSSSRAGSTVDAHVQASPRDGNGHVRHQSATSGGGSGHSARLHAISSMSAMTKLFGGGSKKHSPYAPMYLSSPLSYANGTHLLCKVCIFVCVCACTYV